VNGELLMMSEHNKNVVLYIVVFLLVVCNIALGYKVFGINPKVIYDASNEKELQLMCPVWIVIDNENGEEIYSDLQYYPFSDKKIKQRKDTFLVEINKKTFGCTTNGDTPTGILREFGFQNADFQYTFNHKSNSQFYSLPKFLHITLFDEDESIIWEKSGELYYTISDHVNFDTNFIVPPDTESWGLFLKLTIDNEGSLVYSNLDELDVEKSELFN
jgi:hypothetical protein